MSSGHTGSGDGHGCGGRAKRSGLRPLACSLTVAFLFAHAARTDDKVAPLRSTATVIAVAPAEPDEHGRWVAKFRRAPKAGHSIALFDEEGFVAVADVAQVKLEAEMVEHDARCRRPLRRGEARPNVDKTPIRLGQHFAVVLTPRTELRPLPRAQQARSPLTAFEVDGDARRLEHARTAGAIFSSDGVNDASVDLFGDDLAHLLSAPPVRCTPPPTTKGYWAQCDRLVVKVRGQREREVYFKKSLGCG
jgi:hypothetical protein